MRPDGRAVVPGRFCVFLAAFVAILGVYVPRLCAGQQEFVAEPFVPNKEPPEVQKEEDHLVDEKVAQEKLKEIRNRAFGAGYLAMAPKILCANSQERVFITFVNFSQPVDVQFAVMENDEVSLVVTPLKVITTPCGCVEIDLPPIDKPRMTVTLVMYAKRTLMQCEEFEIVDSIKVYLDACNSETFIETDKPIYKPGQHVQFRVLTLLSDLRPDMSEVSKIWIESPSGIHMAQWLAVKTNDGLIDLSMPMSTDPPMGDWRIKVRHHDREFTQTFKVGEYVLPKFEVMIKGPDYVVVPGGEEEITVCGKYTHGQPVSGSIKLHISVSSNKNVAMDQFARNTNIYGCHVFEVDLSELQWKQVGYINPHYTKLTIRAEFEEAATRTVIEKTVDDIVISQRPFELKFSVPSTFKPGLPFSGMLLFNDPSGKPLAGETGEVIAQAGQPEDLLRKIVISNDRGIAFFTIPDVPQDADYISLQASSLGSDPQSTSHTYGHVKAQFSPSKSFIHIDPVDERAEVDSYQTLTIRMTSQEPEYNGVHLHTLMMARGNIILDVHSIIPPEEIDAFHRPGQYGIYPVKTDEMGMKEYAHSLHMLPSDIPIHILEKGKVKTTRRRFKVSYEMSPAVTVMAYYIRDDGEVVADTVTIPVEEVFQNQVAVKFADLEKQPGQNTTVNIEAKPSSLCAYGVVDKSVHLLGGDNRITKEKVFKVLEDLQLSAEGGSAEPYSKKCQGGGGYGRSFFGGFAPGPSEQDASQSFKDLGVVYLTNLKVETAPCRDMYPIYYRQEMIMEDGMAAPIAMPMLAMASAPMEAVAMAEVGGARGGAPEVRSYFPETWLYSLVRVSSDGQADIAVQVPHTITEWVGHGFCTSSRFGAGVSDLTRLRAYQPFFVDMSLPYSVIRNEYVPMTVVVFNYVTKCLVVELTLQPSSDFEIEEQNRKEHVCVCGGQSVPSSFYIKTVTIGTIEIEVHAVSVDDSDNWCGGQEMDNSQNGFSDAIRKHLLVKPEGVETEQVFSAYFCPEDYPDDTYKEVISLRDLPDNYVSGSERAVVTVTGDMLGPTISNLDHLLKIPTGCGEQNMIGFVPNIFVLHYLKGINKLSALIENKAKENMKIGYQRELNYRRNDNSYSAFGMSDPEGSTWLTAFVMRSFAQAKRYIYIDQEDLDKSTAWLRKQQRDSDGCFESRGRVIHKDMKGSVNDVTTLTAYVIISLIEAGVPLDDAHVQKAIGCLDGKINIDSADMYTLAIASYAYILAGHPNKEDILARLDMLAVDSDDGLRHWEGRPEPVPDDRPPYLHHQASSQHIEITSYVLLTYIWAYSKTEALVQGNTVARWIVGQRNANGGFASTQDTVMALQALAEYGLMAYRGGQQDIQLQVKFSCEPNPHWLYVKDHNRLLLQTLTVPEVPVQVKMMATGPGCVMTQVIVTYNELPEEPAEPPFKISFEQKENKDNNPTPFIGDSTSGV
ncbi:pregnancy zone protein-like [Acanthaster planci]|uniref:Pregnancy zone protein-like n=1 Tax=Acanthaster planci TaxID=133434 RepID=A0A8B7YVH2_ACAPL|nr:pregnancy zone protein-like [Acanthaster planci]